jgi:glutamate-ammonia-ligase adenylyltransferase
MDAAFSTIAFAEPERAGTNLSFLQTLLPQNLWATLPALLSQLPDPDAALNYLERFLREKQATDGVPGLTVDYLARNPAALHHLLVVFSFSRFLAETLIQQPDLIIWLHRPYGTQTRAAGHLDKIKPPEELNAEFARFQATSFDVAPPVILARFKRREYLRIMLRDVLGIATLTETTLELSHLADVLLDRALRLSEQKLQNMFGQPQFTDAAGNRQVARLAIISLGKLGGEELNYSSDIDLMFVYGHEGETSGGSEGSTTNGEYFVRLAQAVLKMITEVTPEGAVFRVDVRLRPQGSEGNLATSLPAALAYYRAQAREWELQMLVKARCSAGDFDAGRRFLREVQPLVYRTEFNLAAVEAALDAREEITRTLEERAGRSEHAAQRNVKLSLGGIRDIEFLAQCLQRLYGGADPWLRSNSTLVALQRLHDKGHITGRDFFRLSAAYQFLRKVEHRLQLRDGLQRHTLPEAADALERLARRCGIEPAPAEGRSAGEQIVRKLEQHFAEVREIYDRTLQLHPPEAPEPEVSAEVEPGSIALLRRLRIEFPRVAAGVAECSEDPYSRRGLLHFLNSAALERKLMGRLEEHPEWLARAAQLFARSDLAVEMLSRNPEEIALVAAPESSYVDALPAGAAAATLDDAMAALRVAYRRSVLATIVSALLAASQPFDTFETLTRLADQALTTTLGVVAKEAAGLSDLSSSPLAVLALGRLGTREMDIGSDSDLVFVVEDHLRGETREPWRRIVERFVQVASSYTREGLLFPVDTRLRPRGSEGEILQTLSYLSEYFRNEAEAWEAATYLKARPVAGNLALGEESIRRVRAAAAERFADPQALARGLVHTRTLMDRSASEPTRGGEPALLGNKGAMKVLPGGFYDVEYALAWLYLTRNLAPAPGAIGHVLRQIAQLESASALGTADAQALRSAALLYRCLDHANRLITGRSARRFPEPALAERVRRLLALWRLPFADDLPAAVEAARRDARALFDRLVVSSAAS